LIETVYASGATNLKLTFFITLNITQKLTNMQQAIMTVLFLLVIMAKINHLSNLRIFVEMKFQNIIIK